MSNSMSILKVRDRKLFLMIALATGVALLLATISGCGTCGNVSAATLKGATLVVTPPTATVAIGASKQYHATLTLAGGASEDVTDDSAWNSSNTAIATVAGATGLGTGVTAGTITVTATYHSLSATAMLIVVPPGPTLLSLVVTPPSGTVEEGGMQQYTATANYRDGSMQNVTATSNWSGSNAAIATVSGAGLGTGVTVGTITVTATYHGLSGTAVLNVINPLVSIMISPSCSALLIGRTAQLTATGTYANGNMQNLTSLASWSSSNLNAATVSTGLVTAVGVGRAVITASYQGVSGSGSATVNSGTSSGSTGILVLPQSGGVCGLIDVAYIPQNTVTNSSGVYTVQAVNLDGTSTSALLASIPMPVNYTPTLTSASQSKLLVVVGSWVSSVIQVVDATSNTVIANYDSGINAGATFSGGTCIICGAVVDDSTGKALLDTAAGYYTMDLLTGAFTPLQPGCLPGSTCFPAENFAFNPLTQQLIDPSYFNPTTQENILTLATNPVGDYANTNLESSLLVRPDSAVVDTVTNTGVFFQEEDDSLTGGAQVLVNLNAATFSSGAWSAPDTVFYLSPDPDENGCGDGEMTYAAHDSSSHILFTANEYYENCAAVEQLGSSSATGAPPAPTQYKFGTMPNDPDGSMFLSGGDPHAIATWDDVVDGKSYGLLIDFPNGQDAYGANWVLKVDLAGALSAPVGSNNEIDFTPYVLYLPTTQ